MGGKGYGIDFGEIQNVDVESGCFDGTTVRLNNKLPFKEEKWSKIRNFVII